MKVIVNSFIIVNSILAVTCLKIHKPGRKNRTSYFENEIIEKTHLITVKFPRVQIPVNESAGVAPLRRRTNINVNPIEENCRTEIFKTELLRLKKRIRCKPRETIVELVAPAGSVITPNTIVVNRCGGMCSGYKRCISAGKMDVKFYVRTIKNNSVYCSSIFVSEDTSCKCACEQKPKDCLSNQSYNKDKCACVCKKEKDYEECIQRTNKDFYWDEKTCSCACAEQRVCTTGTSWVPSECRCAKLLD